MGRLFLFLLAIVSIGVAVRGREQARFVPVSDRMRADPSSATPSPMPTVAYRPGEPMLIPGETTTLQRGADGHFYADATVDGQPVQMLVDTGASTVALTMDDARRLNLPVDPATFQVVGMGASGPTRGAMVMLADVALADRHVGPVRAVVLEGLDRSLLGQSFLGRMNEVRIEGDRMTLR